MLDALVVFSGQLFRGNLPQRRFQKPTGVFTAGAGKAAGFNPGLTVG